MKHLDTYALTAFLSCIILPTYADIDLESLSLEKLLAINVTTVSLVEEPMQTAPGTIQVITRSHIAERGYSNLMEVLQQLPGFDVYDGGNDLYNVEYSLRGITGANKFVILNNGVRVSAPVGELVAIRDNFPLYNIKQIEVFYGPSSALYGADAVTGVINIITEDGVSSDNMLFEVGEDSYQRVHLQKTFIINEQEDISISIGGHWHDMDDSDIGKEYSELYQLSDLTLSDGSIKTASSRKQPSFPVESKSANVSFIYGETFRLDLSHKYESHSTAILDKENFVDWDKDPRSTTTLNLVSMQYKQQLTADWFSKTSLSYNEYELEEHSSYINGFTLFRQQFAYATSSTIDLSQQFDIQINPNNRLVTGFSQEWLSTIPKINGLESPYDPNQASQQQPQFFFNTNEVIQIPVFDVDYTNSAVFLQWQSSWSEVISTTFGVRYDDSSNYGSTVNPRASVLLSLSDDTVIKFLYGEAYFAPPPRWSYNSFGAFDGSTLDGKYNANFFFVPNEELEAEELTNIEVNVDHFFNENLHISASLYHQTLDEVVLAGPTASSQADYFDGGVIQASFDFDNRGQLKIDGFDLSINAFFQLSQNRQIKTWLNASYVDGDFNMGTSSLHLPFVAQKKLRAGLTYRAGPWIVTPTLVYTSAPSLNETNFLGARADSYTLLNLFASWQLSDRFKVQLKIHNLTDKKYGHPGPSFDSSFINVPQQVRRVILGGNYRF